MKNPFFTYIEFLLASEYILIKHKVKIKIYIALRVMNICKNILRLNKYYLKFFLLISLIKFVHFSYFSKYIINFHLYNCTM